MTLMLTLLKWVCYHYNPFCLYLFIMKSSNANYSKSKKMGKKFALRIKQNNEVLKQAKESNK